MTQLDSGRAPETIDVAKQAAEAPPPESPADDCWSWAVLEIFGHRKHAGRIREEERFGTKMLRIDIPVDGAPETRGWRTHWYSGGSIFSLSLTDEASVLRANAPYAPASRISYAAPDRDEEDQDDDSVDFGD